MPSPVRTGAIARTPLLGVRVIPLVIVAFLTVAALASIPASYAVAAGIVAGAVVARVAASTTA